MPYAVRWYTGEAAPDDEDDDEEASKCSGRCVLRWIIDRACFFPGGLPRWNGGLVYTMVVIFYPETCQAQKDHARGFLFETF